jgi:hypothetical protein
VSTDGLEKLEIMARDLLAEIEAMRQPNRPALPVGPATEIPADGWDLFCYGQEHGALAQIEEYRKSRRLPPQVATWSSDHVQACYRSITSDQRNPS